MAVEGEVGEIGFVIGTNAMAETRSVELPSSAAGSSLVATVSSGGPAGCSASAAAALFVAFICVGGIGTAEITSFSSVFAAASFACCFCRGAAGAESIDARNYNRCHGVEVGRRSDGSRRRPAH